MWSYLKEAFLLRPPVQGLGNVPFNLLAVIGLGIFGFVNPGFWLLGLGLEVAYLALLTTNPRFRKWVDAQKAKAVRDQQASGGADTAARILASLPRPALDRFEALRAHCRELQTIAAGLRTTDDHGLSQPLEGMQQAGLDRLLWIYLRLLFTDHMLGRAFQNTSEERIRADVADLEGRLAKLGQDPAQHKKRTALEDNLETCRARLANFARATEHAELVRLELERLENKIRSLNEMAVSRHEPEYIAGQVDQVAGSMVQTERTMQELQFATGLRADEDVPSLLPRETVLGR